MKEVPDHRVPTARQREKYAMVPTSLILGQIVPNGKSESHAMALHLYTYLDLRQGERGEPVRGFRRAAKALGWQERSVSRYAHLLASAGLITIDQAQGRAASTQAIMTVVHNPARERHNAECDVEAVDAKAPPKAGSRYRHGPQPAPSMTRFQQRPLSRPTHRRNEPSERPLSRPVHQSDDPTLSRHVHKLVHDVHQDDPTPVASHATGSRSKRGLSGLREGFRAREGDQHEETATEVSVVRRSEETFGAVKVVDPTLGVCAECGAPADGQSSDGTPMCKAHEPF